MSDRRGMIMKSNHRGFSSCVIQRVVVALFEEKEKLSLGRFSLSF